MTARSHSRRANQQRRKQLTAVLRRAGASSRTDERYLALRERERKRRRKRPGGSTEDLPAAAACARGDNPGRQPVAKATARHAHDLRAPSVATTPPPT